MDTVIERLGNVYTATLGDDIVPFAVARGKVVLPNAISIPYRIESDILTFVDTLINKEA